MASPYSSSTTFDVLGIWGDPAVTCKSVHSGLRSYKKSLPVSHVLNQDGPLSDDDLITRFTTPGGPDEEELRRMAGLIESAGGWHWALAEDALRCVELNPGVRDELLTFGRFIVDREF